MQIIINRTYNSDSTTGDAVILDDNLNVIFEFKTLELPNLNNQRGISCILEGTYKCHKNTWQPKFGNHFDILNTKDRAGVKIHSGNYTSQIRGCILPGDKLLYLNKDKTIDISNSKKTLAKIFELMPNEFNLVINKKQ